MTRYDINIMLFSILAFIQLVDVIITGFTLLDGGAELNFLFNALHFGIIGIAFTKFFLTLAIGVLIFLLKDNRIATYLLVTTNLWYTIGLLAAVLGFIH